MVKKYLLFTVVCLVLAACSLGMNDMLGRTTDDPFEEIPNVVSFNGDYSIMVSWSRDAAADEYYLYRAADNIIPQYQLIYRGPLTEYKDTFSLTQDGYPYLYRLGKRRGQRRFEDLITPGKAALGIVSVSKRDDYEPNDTLAQATHLSYNELFANSWFYTSNTTDGISIYDDDWYCVDIPARWIAVITLNDIDALGNTDYSHFKLEIWGRGTVEIFSNRPKEIVNPSAYAQRIYFRLYADYAAFRYNYPMASGGSGRFIQYTIKVANFMPGG